MSRSNYDKPFYVDVGTSIIAVRCASNHDVILEYDYARCSQIIHLAEACCDRMNKEAEIGKPRRNCDVGTAEEQAERFYNFCTEHSSAIHGMCNYNCPCIDSVDKCHCLCKWAQMPYEKGGST